MKAEHRREAVDHGKDRGLSVRRGSALVGLHRSTYYYELHPRDDTALAARLKSISEDEPRFGYRRAWAIVCREDVLNLKAPSKNELNFREVDEAV